jgi:hypothetical protein
MPAQTTPTDVPMPRLERGTDQDGHPFVQLVAPDGYRLEGEEPGLYYIVRDEDPVTHRPALARLPQHLAHERDLAGLREDLVGVVRIIETPADADALLRYFDERSYDAAREILLNNADVHSFCGNATKADALRDLADRVANAAR